MFTCGTSNQERIKTTVKTKNLLEKFGVQYEVLNLKNHPKANYIEGAMNLHSGYSSFPNIYFGTKHVGGYDDLIIYT